MKIKINQTENGYDVVLSLITEGDAIAFHDLVAISLTKGDHDLNGAAYDIIMHEFDVKEYGDTFYLDFDGCNGE